MYKIYTVRKLTVRKLTVRKLTLIFKMSDDDNESVSDNSQHSSNVNIEEVEEMESLDIRTEYVPKILTYNCLFAYAIERIKRIEFGTMLWPPIILKIRKCMV